MEGEVKLLKMEERLHRRVVGQDDAIRANAVRRSPANLRDRSWWAALSSGPTGVGKTELARALAEFLFDDEDAMVRIDASEYQERHTVVCPGRAARLHGLRRGGQLTGRCVAAPTAWCSSTRSKAHRDVFNTLLRFDDGRLTDSQGDGAPQHRRDHTSNSGSQYLQGHNYDEQAALEALRNHFPPEFLNGSTNHHVQPASRAIWPDRRIQAEHPAAPARPGYRAALHRGAKRLLAEEGYDPAYGARR